MEELLNSNSVFEQFPYSLAQLVSYAKEMQPTNVHIKIEEIEVTVEYEEENSTIILTGGYEIKVNKRYQFQTILDDIYQDE